VILSPVLLELDDSLGARVAVGDSGTTPPTPIVAVTGFSVLPGVTVNVDLGRGDEVRRAVGDAEGVRVRVGVGVGDTVCVGSGVGSDVSVAVGSTQGSPGPQVACGASP
jgi:hypothetical protein